MTIKYLRTNPVPRSQCRNERTYATAHWNKRWIKLSAQWIRDYPFCILCLCKGKLNEGATLYPSERQRSLVVDHIKPHRNDDVLFWDTDNLETLCRAPCHDRDKQAAEKGHRDWLSILRDAIREHNAEAFVAQNQLWIPPALRTALIRE